MRGGVHAVYRTLALVLGMPALAVAALPYMVVDLTPGPGDADIDSLHAAGTRAVFRRAGADLWSSDATQPGTVPLLAGAVGKLTTHGARVFFTRPSATAPYEEVWRSDGTAQGTTQLASIASIGSCPIFDTCSLVSPYLGPFVPAGSLLYFGQSGRILWRSDGTPGGTFAIADYTQEYCSTSCLCCFPLGLALGPFAGVNERLYFGGYADFTGPMGLLVADGSAATQVVTDPTPAGLAGVWGTAFFTVNDLAGTSLWRSDGAGTRSVAGFGMRDASALTAAGGLLYFVLDAGTAAAQLWRSDGTAAGTVALLASDAADLTAAGGLLFFRRPDPGGDTLWRSDGTVAGTTMVSPLAPGWLTDLGGTLYFVAADAAGGAELWRSDGTAGGTMLVDDIVPGPDGSEPADLAAGCGRLYFTAETPAAGRELWALDVSPGSCPVAVESSCTADAQCSDHNPCTADVCDAASGCTASRYPCCFDAQCNDHDACTVDDCQQALGCMHTPLAGFDAITCVLGDAGSEAAQCPGETIPERITRRLDRVRRAVARAQEANTPVGEARRLRSALRKLTRVLVRIDREAENGTISGLCHDALADLAATARARVQALYDAL